MNKITFPLEHGKQGSEVGDLQAALQLFLDKSILLENEEGMRREYSYGLRRENAEQIYSDYTSKLVSIFQEERRLEAHGKVDEQTANAMNAILRNLGLLNVEGWTQVVEALNTQGQTLSAISLGTDRLASIDEKIGTLGKAPLISFNTRGKAVRSLHEQLHSLGVSLPANETAEGIFGVGTRDALLQLQAKHDLVRTGLFDDATRNALAIAVGSVSQPRRVEGRILLDNGLPASRVKLSIVHKGFGEDAVVLGETETDERGFYALPYDTNGTAANIEVRTFDANSNEVRLSNPKVNADRSEVINLVAPSTVISQANEFALMASDLGRFVGSDLSKLALAQESEERQDLTLLHQSTDWDARLIARASSAAQLNAVTGISHEALYGVIRAGLPDDPEALSMVSPEAFATALKRANEASVIALDAEQMAAANQVFEQFAMDKRRNMIVPGMLSNVGDMLDQVRMEPDHKAVFEKLVLMHDGEDEELWVEAKAQGIPRERIADMQLQGKLAYLTLNNAPLTKALQDELGSQDNLAQLVEKDLYKQDEWVDRLHRMAYDDGTLNPDKVAKLIPAAYTHKDINDRVTAYANDLARKVRQSFPTHVISRMLAKDDLTLGAQHAEMKAPVQSLLNNAVTKGFQLGRTPVGQFLMQHGETLFDGFTEDDKQLAETGVKLLTRAYQMTPNDESMTKLLALGFTSARQVASIPKAEFVGRYAKDFGSSSETTVIWDKSVQITSSTFNIFTLAKKLDSTPPIHAITGNSERHEKSKEELKSSLLKAYPTMESLFGSLDYCECDHCRSVLSPAAYLVDLLRFIDPIEQDWKLTLDSWAFKHNGRTYTGPDYHFMKPYDALIQRRPDLPHLPLTCENTNTALPYIDLVNEILEYYVANDQMDEKAVRDTGEATSAELIAEPHNLIPLAYDTLKDANYPLTLPFDLWLETVRRFCAYFETPFWKVLDTFRPSDNLFAPASNPEAYYRASIFAEYVGLSPKEYDIYAAPAIALWPKLYGYDKENDTEATTLESLISAKTLSRRLGVTYKELAELIKTEFVNPRLNTLVMLRKLGVEVSDVFRYKKHEDYIPLTPEEEAELVNRLTQLTEKFQPPFNASKWLDDSWEDRSFEKILVLRDADAGCDFDQTTVCYANPNDPVQPLDFVKLNLFVRLWKRLGWTMEETDLALQTFFILPEDDVISDEALGNAMKTALIYLAHLKELNELINVGKNSRIKLLTLWAGLPTKGKNSLYAQLFLTRKSDVIFDDPLGNYLSNPNVQLIDHLQALQAALNLTADEISQILQDGNKGDEGDVTKAKLSLANVSLLHRYGLLAKALKMSISELISLKVMSGLNPFHPLSSDVLNDIQDDIPLQHTIEFVRRAKQLKSSTFSISDLEYLFRHRVDPLGKYREDVDARLAWMGTLSAKLRTIASDFAVPSSADSISDDALRQKLAMAFAPDVVEMLLDKVAYSATKENVVPNSRLDPNTYGKNGVSVSYDETRERQQVTYVGVLTAAAKNVLLNLFPQPAFDDQAAIEARNTISDLLDEIVLKSTDQYRVFFDMNFDVELLNFDDFFGAEVTETRENKRLNLVKKILPFLQAKLARQAIWQTMTTQTGGDPALIEYLLTNSNALSLPDSTNESLTARFEGLGKSGFTLLLTPTDLNKQPFKLLDERLKIKESDKCNKAQWKGCIEVPQSGAYRFFAHLGKKGAKVHLRIDSAVEPILSGTAANDDAQLSGFIDMKSGTLYAVTLDASDLQDGAFQLLIKGETTTKCPFNQLVAMIPHDELDGATRAYAMLTKTSQLAQELGLSERDVRHILAYAADFGGVDWRLLPIQEPGVVDSSVALFNGFLRLLDYATLKRDMAGGGDDLIAVFEEAHRLSTNQPDIVKELCLQIATMTRRKSEGIQAAATVLKMTEALHFADASRMERLWQALQIVEKYGVSVVTLKRWLTPRPDASVAMDVRNTIKARYEPEIWQRIAKGIFDPLRQLQRDALVARIMYMNEELDSEEKLFEYFLIDPGTEPVVQTSRLRLAISSLQTFIQRCFLNLEKRVHPSVLNTQHWSWMKRYRVWEANRKIFLYPENWLEPEWRDDKTHLYQELESSLLQGDVTNQLAEDALYVYLKKLDQLARLEIVTMHAEERPPGPPIMHVIGRTYLFPHQYFYRKYANQMWTPWEPISVEIDGDHVVAVMWRERLHLFWLTFMEKVEESKDGPQSMQKGPTGGLGLNILVSETATVSKGAAKRILDTQLNWSEYDQGAWTPRESSGFGNTLPITTSFDASKVMITVSKENDPETGADTIVWINMNLNVSNLKLKQCFRVASRNSRPQFMQKPGKIIPASPYSYKEVIHNRYKGSGPLAVTFVQSIETTDGVVKATPPAPQTILSKGGSYNLLPTNNQLHFPNEEFASLISPSFYADDLYTFFVEPSLTETTVDRWEGYTITHHSQRPKWIDFVERQPHLLTPVIPPKYNQEVFKLPEYIPDFIDPLALHEIQSHVDELTHPNIGVQYGDTIIGSSGRIHNLDNMTDIVTSIGGSINLRNRGAGSW
ncbi:neuraminidase-like domain-containing protein [Cohnella silvisoli]|uniref:Neuraminidase-like domain-containing protein n=1 Tax=Cohnella silvisoli TaxID=2873699 RepID=A0ABV1L176_9BACL|nr:neuraminidase-like domain-containing protein [Cohnella silvisoli]MCD9025517.1 peptidoglycan-binding protein [Cohnella silvisoli]